jgi:hypothetical protein
VKALVSARYVERRIYFVRGLRVMIDSDLAELYGVQSKALNRAVRRNQERFPEDFMFQLTPREAADLRCQTGTSSSSAVPESANRWGGRRYLPFVFTEQGVAMLSSILRSPRAVCVNIAIVRAFVRLRRTTTGYLEFDRKLASLERKYKKHDKQIHVVFDAIRRLVNPSPVPKRRIGFRAGEDVNTP